MNNENTIGEFIAGMILCTFCLGLIAYGYQHYWMV